MRGSGSEGKEERRRRRRGSKVGGKVEVVTDQKGKWEEAKR